MNNYHAHIYFDSQQADAVMKARQLRSQLAEQFHLPVGRLHLQPIGPHPRPMFQALLQREDLSNLVPWLMQNRGDLDILIHADTGNDLLDHSRHVLWLGSSLPLRLEALQG